LVCHRRLYASSSDDNSNVQASTERLRSRMRPAFSEIGPNALPDKKKTILSTAIPV
jgi:hypothetical protein